MSRRRRHNEIRALVARRGWGSYPTAEEATASVNPQIRLRPAARDALERYARSGPWRGSDAERYERAARLLRRLATAYGIPAPSLTVGPISSLGRCVVGSERCAIILARPISVVSLLHEFGHALGKTEAETVRWSLSVFARFWPRSFARLTIRDRGLATYDPDPPTVDEIENAVTLAAVETAQ